MGSGRDPLLLRSEEHRQLRPVAQQQEPDVSGGLRGPQTQQGSQRREGLGSHLQRGVNLDRVSQRSPTHCSSHTSVLRASRAFPRSTKAAQAGQPKVLIRAGGVPLPPTIAGTPGLGDTEDTSHCWPPVIDGADSKSEDHPHAASRVNGRPAPDDRVQGRLSLIAPSGRGRGPLGTGRMEHLREKVNATPCIANADPLTPGECQRFKQQVTNEIQEHKVKIYECPETEGEEENKLVKNIKDHSPLAVASRW